MPSPFFFFFFFFLPPHNGGVTNRRAGHLLCLRLRLEYRVGCGWPSFQSPQKIQARRRGRSLYCHGPTLGSYTLCLFISPFSFSYYCAIIRYDFSPIYFILLSSPLSPPLINIDAQLLVSFCLNCMTHVDGSNT